MSFIKIIYKDSEVNYNGTLQGAIESAFRYDPEKSGYIEVLDENITENIQGSLFVSYFITDVTGKTHIINSNEIENYTCKEIFHK